ncbi:MAG: alpha/beta hydrolase [Erysipelotrichaceae bacterium]|nr:alpha/beta hydrolase [Erysipelotrichaceae bacterium]
MKTSPQVKKIIRQSLKLTRIKQRFLNEKNAYRYMHQYGQHTIQRKIINMKHLKSFVKLENVETLPVIQLTSNIQNNHIIIYLHGGAFVEGCTSFHLKFMDQLVQSTNITLICPHYARLPFSNAKHTLHELNLMIKQVIELNPLSISLVADSAGAWLALSLAQIMRDQYRTMPAHLFLLSPWLDLTMNKVDPDLEHRDVILRYEGLRYLGQQFNPNQNVGYQLNDSLHHLGQIHLFSTNDELFYDQVMAFQTQANKENITINVHIDEALFHDYMLFPLPESKEILRNIIQELRTLTEK